MKKVQFFRSVNFKIALSFFLILLIAIEIIGGYFIRGLETTTIIDFKKNIDVQVTQLANSLSTQMNVKGENRTEIDAMLKKTLTNLSTNEIIEARVVDDKGIIRATNDNNQQGNIGQKNDYRDLNDFSNKKYVALDNNKRVYINVQPIQSPTGETVIGVLFVKSNLESKYQEITNTASIFFTASIIAGIISVVITLLISRSITKPIGEMKEQALRISRGDYSGKVQIYGKDELGQLAETFNQLSERVEETQETMEAERNRLNSVLSHMTDGVIATDRRGKILTINEMALSLLDVKTEEAIGTFILTLLDIEADYNLRKLLEAPNELLIDRSVSNKNDEQLIIRADFTMIRRESGFITGIVCVLHDVTEQEKNERERREFVSNVSHELRTPLTSMHSYIEALSEGAWKNPEVAPDFLKVTLEETDRMIRMINDLLNLSRMDSGTSELQLEYVNFNELVNFVLDRFDMMLDKEKKNYTIDREFTRRDLWLEIDTDKIIQVLDNILNNAIKYSPDGGKITCRLLETHNNAVFSVTDQGLGIPKKDIAKVFDRFYRVDKARARKQGGTGLGLAISKEVIRAHNGFIWVESEEGKGSTFYISLPYEPFEEDWWE
ncbi:cell wall metabolism sensor histidine kinase WalK [Melissococcus plutonius]|uniref:histidine kinase n=1 Tax=Melissococcus plutonius TaxID=33970 RepID=A0A2Z5Y1M8_9ENTE|nr:cell wall metabolism sensor histidine kinase WalK [Melissococcus plutonius]BAL61897.1 two-component sensor kinase [Melissococcus plutonius DAT561]MCV2499498.1 cell wall metabolism sensor histidine kinase WalK [Melissococcus plutonius]MCV2501131.1 cell wall metabolism sensor histidine kinase WalK [Melissococcus plutonius]MCV2505765.1 cell wall metabolism sensor histidine kinase WalK [Melissococcus plutonius]MCV2508017.1 cell wall metabolism sensor histidine kinase WalK [Melissococcus plutoni